MSTVFKRIKKQILNFALPFSDLGVVVSIMDSIALIYGLFNAFIGKIIEIKLKLSVKSSTSKKKRPLFHPHRWV